MKALPLALALMTTSVLAAPDPAQLGAFAGVYIGITVACGLPTDAVRDEIAKAALATDEHKFLRAFDAYFGVYGRRPCDIEALKVFRTRFREEAIR